MSCPTACSSLSGDDQAVKSGGAPGRSNPVHDASTQLQFRVRVHAHAHVAVYIRFVIVCMCDIRYGALLDLEERLKTVSADMEARRLAAMDSDESHDLMIKEVRTCHC